MRPALQLSISSKEQPDEETKAVLIFAQRLSHVGISTQDAIAIWVALKSTPSIIFSHQDLDRADEIAQATAQAILQEAPQRIFKFQGHPWWGQTPGTSGDLTQAQQRFTALRLRALLDEASSSSGESRTYFAVFKRISHAEIKLLSPFASPEAGSRRRLIKIPNDLADEVASFPENVYLLSTMNPESIRLHGWETRIVPMLFPLQGLVADRTALRRPARLRLTSILLANRCFESRRAWRRIPLEYQKSKALVALRESASYLLDRGVPGRHPLARLASLLLGNAWSGTGQGLFDRDPDLNAALAYRYWLRLAVLPLLERLEKVDPSMRLSLQNLIAQQARRPGLRLLQRLL